MGGIISEFLSGGSSNDTLLVSENETDYNATDTYCPLEGDIGVPLWMFAPATILTCILMLIEVRRFLCLRCCCGHCALVVPLNVLENKRDRLPYLAAFALISLSLSNVVMGGTGQYLFDIQNPSYLEMTLLKLLYVVIVCVVFFPIFACCTVDNFFAVIIGVLYVILFMVIKIVQLVHEECNDDDLKTTALVTQILTHLVTYVSGICYIGSQIYKIVKKRTFFCKRKQQDYEINSYDVIYVKRLLTPEKRLQIKMKFGGRLNVIYRFAKNVHTNIPGFRYSVSILSSITVANVIIFVYSTTLVFKLLDYWRGLRKLAVQLFGDSTATVSPSTIFTYLSNKFILKGKGKTVITKLVSLEEFIEDHIAILFVSCILATIFAFFSICGISIHMLQSYRKNMKSIYKREAATLLHLHDISNVSLVVNANQYMGYQVAYLVWGFLLQMVFLTVVFFIIGEIIVFPLIYGMWGYLWGFVEMFGPIILIMILTIVIQYLLVKFFFLQERGAVLALTNRRAYSNMMYFMFFYNMILGLMSCLLRIIKSVVFGLIFLPRLDRSIFPKTFERFDPGYKAYICLLRLEALQSNPIILTFLYHLTIDVQKKNAEFAKFSAISKTIPSVRSQKCSVQLTSYVYQATPQIKTKKAFQKIDGPVTKEIAKRKLIARTRWFLAWTLIHNPSLAIKRWHTKDGGSVAILEKNDFIRF